MDVLVVGATGTLGRQIARRALDEGHRVRCLVRSPKRGNFLREWGCDLVRGDLTQPETLTFALEGIEAVIDAATTRSTDSLSCYDVDWQGKVNLIQAAANAGVQRFIFCSIIDAEKHRDVPLMDIKYCVEEFLKQSGLNYTILRLAGFMQGLIAEFAIPVLEGRTTFVTQDSDPIAYLSTLDIARFAVAALTTPATEKQTLPVVGPKAWNGLEIIQLCERISGKETKIARLPLATVRLMKRFFRFFQWGWNIADRLAFSEVMASGRPFTADMTATYAAFGIDPAEITDLESYLNDYFSVMLRRLKELEFDQKKNKKKKVPF
ncbi:NmrA family NAD(P)-binding protein [Synechococcus elongatus IITB4]|uniref:NmrA family NAD(P)-binding protein n=1 Tax=Synechococcus elongatus TaxID=32046 RepID=UPI0030D572BF